ncbi:hypothetical protein C9980_12800 [Vibrio mediterranei]|nr:hypothetical protein C9980_12800 [Vibrio mediterranei]
MIILQNILLLNRRQLFSIKLFLVLGSGFFRYPSAIPTNSLYKTPFLTPLKKDSEMFEKSKFIHIAERLKPKNKKSTGLQHMSFGNTQRHTREEAKITHEIIHVQNFVSFGICTSQKRSRAN